MREKPGYFYDNDLACGIRYGNTALLACGTRYGNTVPLPTPSLSPNENHGRFEVGHAAGRFYDSGELEIWLVRFHRVLFGRLEQLETHQSRHVAPLMLDHNLRTGCKSSSIFNIQKPETLNLKNEISARIRKIAIPIDTDRCAVK